LDLGVKDRGRKVPSRGPRGLRRHLKPRRWPPMALSELLLPRGAALRFGTEPPLDGNACASRAPWEAQWSRKRKQMRRLPTKPQLLAAPCNLDNETGGGKGGRGERLLQRRDRPSR